MKKKIFAPLFFLTVATLFGQTLTEAQLPQVVKDNFKALYPGQKVSKWEKEGLDYEAEFTNNKVETSVLFDRKGTLLATEVEIPVKELPQSIKDYVKNKLGGKKIAEASKITDNKSVVTYEAEVGGDDYIFDTNGKLIKKETDTVKDDDKK